MTTRRWRVSGGRSSRSWCITVGIGPGGKRYKILPSISRSSITGSACRQGSASCLLRSMNKDTMPDCWRHERFGVHYCHPTSIPARSSLIVMKKNGRSRVPSGHIFILIQETRAPRPYPSRQSGRPLAT